MSKRKPKKSQKKSKPSRKRREAKAKNISVSEVKASKKPSRLKQKVGEQQNRLSAWYLSKSTPVKVALGLIVIPILIALFLLQGVILPFLIAAYGLSKIVLIWLKGPAFIVYISYKVFKTLLGLYYCVSRSITGIKAERQRRQQARNEVTEQAIYPSLLVKQIEPTDISLHASIKTIRVHYKEHQQRVLFSYLRYFIIGQIFMYCSFWIDRYAYLTLWRAKSRARVKEIFSHIGGTIFTPHLLGAHLNQKRLLVPGDAKLLSISGSEQENMLKYKFEVSWQEWRFSKSWPLISAETKRETWSIPLPLDLDSISKDEVGYLLHRVED